MYALHVMMSIIKLEIHFLKITFAKCLLWIMYGVRINCFGKHSLCIYLAWTEELAGLDTI